MHFVERLRRELRRKVSRFVWGQVGFATSVLALGRWPEWLSDMLVGMHEHAYFKWADTRDFTPRCYVCTQPLDEKPRCGHRNLDTFNPCVLPLDHDGAHLTGQEFGIFCSPECRTKFEEHVRKSKRVMPSPVGTPQPQVPLEELEMKLSTPMPRASKESPS